MLNERVNNLLLLVGETKKQIEIQENVSDITWRKFESIILELSEGYICRACGNSDFQGVVDSLSNWHYQNYDGDLLNSRI